MLKHHIKLWHGYYYMGIFFFSFPSQRNTHIQMKLYYLVKITGPIQMNIRLKRRLYFNPRIQNLDACIYKSPEMFQSRENERNMRRCGYRILENRDLKFFVRHNFSMRSYIFDVCSLQIKLIYICTTWHFSIRINNKLAIVFSARSPSKKVLTISIWFFTIHKENTKESSHSREGFFTSFQNYSTIFKPFPKH